MWLTFVDHVKFLFGSADFESEEHSYRWRSQMSDTLLKTDAISVTTMIVINIMYHKMLSEVLNRSFTLRRAEEGNVD